MRCDSRQALPPEGGSHARRRIGAAGARLGLVLLLGSSAPTAETLTLVHQQRYSMGTMFDVLVYHASRDEAERAIRGALDEIVRLDRVLSSFKPESDLSMLNRRGRDGEVLVDAGLYEVLEQSLAVSRRSGGRFDVTIAPLLRTWKRARDEGRNPSAAELVEARRCVGYEKIDAAVPRRIRFRSDCLEIDLGGIGKGYAVDRALAVLKAAGIRHAVVNAGSSSIGAMGAPPDERGWAVRLAAPRSAARAVRLRDTSMSTSQQNGDILDPRTGAPAASPLLISVVAPNAALSDALSTTLVVLSIEDGKRLLAQFDDVSAIWMTPEGEIRAVHGRVPGCE